jgi:hypothetical protein
MYTTILTKRDIWIGNERERYHSPVETNQDNQNLSKIDELDLIRVFIINMSYTAIYFYSVYLNLLVLVVFLLCIDQRG